MKHIIDIEDVINIKNDDEEEEEEEESLTTSTNYNNKVRHSSIIIPTTCVQLLKWFRDTKFGCMSDPLVRHFEPSTSCSHLCVYCYANSYKNVLSESEAMKECVDMEDIRLAVKSLADKLFAKMRKLKSEIGPEIHFSISTDVLQPNIKVQERSFIVMKTWLEYHRSMLISIVSKGVPYSVDMRERFLKLFAEHPDQVSFQCTCASVDADVAKYLEPGAPYPEKRIQFLEQVSSVAGVKRISFRMNPLVPGFNDSDEQMAATIDRAAKVPNLHNLAISYMYGSFKIFEHFEKITGVPIKNRFVQDKRIGLSGGAPKFHVSASQRVAVFQFARERRSGLKINTCGCDNKDIFPDHKCGICWRSENDNNNNNKIV